MKRQTSQIIEYSKFTCNPDTTVKVRRPGDSRKTAQFCFQDSRWYLCDLVRPHESANAGNIGFSDLPQWLVNDAKKYIAHLWLRHKPEIIKLHKIMVALRHLGRILKNFKGEPIQLRARHAKQFTRGYTELNLSPSSKQGTRRFINGFMTFVREQHPEVTDNDFVITFPISEVFIEQHRPLEKSASARITTDRLRMIIDACVEDTRIYLEAKKDYVDLKEFPREYAHQHHLKKKAGIYPKPQRTAVVKDLHRRAIKAQATILAICAGRRAASICNTHFDVKTSAVKWATETGQEEHGVMVRFKELKIRNIYEDVFCPGAFGDLAINAIKTAKELTQELRQRDTRWKDYLYIIPAQKRNKVSVLRPSQMNRYLNGEGDFPGLLKRYNIPGAKITIHNFRATRATNAWVGGLQVHEVAYDLGHLSAEMTVRHYIVGNEESRRRLQFLMNHGAIRGIMEECSGGQEIIEARIGKRHVEILKRQGRMLTPTRYGYCALPASSGPCPTANPCYLGPGGCDGCDHHVLSPDALPALEEDKEVLETNISSYADDPGYRAWVENQRNQLKVVELNIARATSLDKRMSNCGMNCKSCGGDNR
jgi:hypothetical protein